MRGDLADVELADRVFAPHYAKACAFDLISDTHLRVAPLFDAEIVSVLPAGVRFDLLDISGGWAWGSCTGKVGYVLSSAIKAS